MLNKRVTKVAAASVFIVLFWSSSREILLLNIPGPAALLVYPPKVATTHTNRTTTTASERGVLVQYNYTPPAIETAFSGLSSTNRSAGDAHRRPAKPIPVQVMEQYKAWHSVESLRRDPHNRLFSVVYYSCPVEAGNRLHHYLSALYWSILTNRTLLWKYLDYDTCSKRWGPNHCRDANTAPECDALLARAPWIPSHDEWVTPLGLGRPHQLPYYTTNLQRMKHRRHPWGPGNDEQVQGVDVKYQDVPLVEFPVRLEKIGYMQYSGQAKELLHSEWSRRVNVRLHRHGVEFWFGVLLRYSFELTDHLKESFPSDPYLSLPRPVRKRQYYSIALHSRHIDPELDGCDVSNEETCIRRLSPKWNSKAAQPRHCVVHLMSDRPCTLTSLAASLPALECQVITANHQTGVSHEKEHGPFAGAGFLQDWALASMATSAFVGHKRSSSDLVYELLVFDRQSDAWLAAVKAGIVDPKELANAVDKSKIQTCILPDSPSTTRAKKFPKAHPRKSVSK